MKKLISIFAIVILFAVSVPAQRVVMASYADTLSGSQTKYYPAASMPDLAYGSFQAYVDHLTGTSDSTYVYLQGSTDNVIWNNLQLVTYAGSVASTTSMATDFKCVRFSDTDAGFLWHISAVLTLPYYRFAVTHYATGTVRFKGYLYKKK